MKKLKLNLFMVVALAIAAVTMSFKMAGTASTFHYASESTAAGAFANPDNWEPGTSPTNCVGTAKPCQITAEDEADLESKLAGKTNPQVLSIVDSKRK